MELQVCNITDAPFQYEAALHTYLAVADVRRIGIAGLEGAAYLDKVDGLQRKLEGTKPIRITGETDRVYPGTRARCVIDDPKLARRITAAKSGSDTTVLWNPWIAKAKAMSDFGDDEWPAMVCVETANAGENAITLAPGSAHTMRATVFA